MKTHKLQLLLALMLGLVTVTGALAFLGILGNGPVVVYAQENVLQLMDDPPDNLSRPILVIANQGQLLAKSNPITEAIIIIDDAREGWEDVMPYPGDPIGDNGEIGNIDWNSISLAHDCDQLYGRYEVKDGPSFNPEGYRYNMFVDSDRNRNTGFRGVGLKLSIGADALLQGGYDGPSASMLTFRFIGATQEDWNWALINVYPAHDKVLADSRRDIEWKVLKSDLNISNTGVISFNWVAFGDNASGVFDYYPDGGEHGDAGDFYTYNYLDWEPSQTMGPVALDPLAVTINYTSTTDDFPNPERGFYKFFDTKAASPTPLTVDMLAGITETLIFRLYYLETFTQTPISADYLAMIADDMGVIRNTGKKAIIRFAYKDDFSNNDASLEQVLAHLDQLEDVLGDNSDVIAVVQAGFIGAWGEWHNAHPDFGNPDPDYPARRQVISRLLEIVPITRMVQVRTPCYKQNLVNDSTPVTKAVAHRGSPKARIGHHNDCFLSSATDFHTYVYTPTEYPYLEEDTKWVVMGGETCDPSFADDPAPPRLTCETALKEMEQFHESFLNRDWYTPTLEQWRIEGCLPEIERRLGYRFTLLQGTFDNQVSTSGEFRFTLQLENVGFAAPFNPRAVELILRHTDGTTYTFALPAEEPRFWLPGETHTISHTITLLPNMPVGDYELLLNLPDPEPELHRRPEYAIRLANKNVWETGTGYNKLNHTLVVDPSVSRTYLPIILKSN